MKIGGEGVVGGKALRIYNIDFRIIGLDTILASAGGRLIDPSHYPRSLAGSETDQSRWILGVCWCVYQGQ